MSLGREDTFFDGTTSGRVHVEVRDPYCAGLRQQLIALASRHQLEIKPSGTHVYFNGLCFETAAEMRMATQWGGDVVGLT